MRCTLTTHENNQLIVDASLWAKKCKKKYFWIWEIGEPNNIRSFLVTVSKGRQAG